MKKYNISKPEKYIKDGTEKTYWANVGTMTEWEKEDGSVSRIIEIPAIGLKANVFPVAPKQLANNFFGAPMPANTPDSKKYAAGQNTASNEPLEIPSIEEELPDPKDIPF